LKKATVATYSYNEVGERTKTTPASGPATTYEYNQAGDLTAVTRPKEGSTPAIEDTYAYNGDGLRMAKTSSGSTTYFAWDVAEELPLVLSDGTYSYIYGADGYPIEQINSSAGTVTYLHHDQQGSTRLLTGATGAVEGKCTYGAYGTSTCEGTASPLGYDGQYTEADTGLIYLRARYYDPATAQFVSVDARLMETNAAYTYALDDPLAGGDPTGDVAQNNHILGAYELIVLANRLRAVAADSELLSAALKIAGGEIGEYVGTTPEAYATYLLHWAARFEAVAESLQHRHSGDANGFLVRESYTSVGKLTVPYRFREAYCWYKGARGQVQQFWCGKEGWWHQQA
jgi:RHS repeat-associated protein